MGLNSVDYVARSPRILYLGYIKNLLGSWSGKITKDLQTTLIWLTSPRYLKNSACGISHKIITTSWGENSLSIVYVAIPAGLSRPIWRAKSPEILWQASPNTLLVDEPHRFFGRGLWTEKSTIKNRICARFRQGNLVKTVNWGLSFKRNWTCSSFFERNCRGNWRWYNIGHYISGEILIQTLWTWSEFYLRSSLTRYLTYSDCPK